MADETKESWSPASHKEQRRCPKCSDWVVVEECLSLGRKRLAVHVPDGGLIACPGSRKDLDSNDTVLLRDGVLLRDLGPDSYVTAEEHAERTGVPVSEIKTAVSGGLLDGVVSDDLVLVTEREVDAWVASRRKA
jgi:hypothetical protein